MEVFVMKPDFLKLIKNDKTYLEREPFEKITKKTNLWHLNTMAFGNAWTP